MDCATPTSLIGCSSRAGPSTTTWRPSCASCRPVRAARPPRTPANSVSYRNLGSRPAQYGPSNRCPLLCRPPRFSCVPGQPKRRRAMPRYIVERTFPRGLHIPQDSAGADICRSVVSNNTAEAVTWVHSYVTEDKSKTFCVYDGPNPEAIRKTAQRNDLPVDRITQVSVLDPYFYS